MAEGESTASNFIWAFAFIIIVAILAAVIYFSGVLSSHKKQDINIKVDAPAVNK